MWFSLLDDQICAREDGWRLLFKQWKGFKAAIVTSLLLSPMLFGIRLALGRSGWQSISWSRLLFPKAPRAWLHMLALGPLLLTGLLGVLGIVKVAENFFTPMIFLVPTAIIFSSRFAVAGHRLQRSVYAGRRFWRLGCCCHPQSLWRCSEASTNTAQHPPEAAREATKLWHETVGPDPEVKYVAGTERYALGLMFYIADRPSDFTHFSYAEAPWVTRERIVESGLLAVCLVKDGDCLEKVQALALQGLHRFDRDLRASFFGMEGPVRQVAIFVLPPAKVSKVRPAQRALAMSRPNPNKSGC